MYLLRVRVPPYSSALWLASSVALAIAGCDSTEAGGPLDASPDARALDDGGTVDAGPDANDASEHDASLDDAGASDASLADASVGTLCGEAWVDVAVDVQHCGGCEQDCTLLPGVDASLVVCASGSCVLACDPHRADCDGKPDTGCEATLDTAARCGACGNACPSAAHASALCDEGVCAIACDVGYHDCGGVCVDDTDVTSCGAACAPCATDPHGVAGCELGACTLVCAPGYAVVDGHCAIGDACEASPGVCGPGAIRCDAIEDSYACTCAAGFVAPTSGGACTDENECATTPGICGTYGTGGGNGRGCTNVAGTYTCSCLPGAFAPATGGVCATTCGDGVQGPGEMCDDGGRVENDGCSSTCRLETSAGWNCTGTAPTRCALEWTFNAWNEGFASSSPGHGIFIWSPTPGAWGANASAMAGDFALASPTRVAPPGTLHAVVVVTHAVNFQLGRDGGVVEASVDGGAFTGLEPVSGQAYNRWFGGFSGNPLGERLGFSGQLASTTSIFHVPVTAGHAFRIRFRVGTDANANDQPPNPAWTIENVSVTFAR